MVVCDRIVSMRALIHKINQLKSSLLEKTAVQLVLNTVKQLGYDSAADIAGSIAYYSILSIFPLLLGVISILGFFLPSEIVQKQIYQFLESNLPASVDLVKHNITHVISLRGTLGIVSLLGLFWTGSAIFGVIGRAMNKAWKVFIASLHVDVTFLHRD